jgi:adenine-specific DNA-methyltransferase
LKLRNRIVWAFEHGLHAKRRFSGRYEVALWFSKGDEYIFHLDRVRVPQKYPNKRHFKGPKKGELSGNPLGKNPGDVWIFPNVKANHVEKTAHPAQYPVELVERFVLALTEEGDWVLDPFGGSGTTVIAALMHRRRGAMAEIVPEYVDLARTRLQEAWEGKLRVRPMEREVYDPTGKSPYVPPRLVNLKAIWEAPLFAELQ